MNKRRQQTLSMLMESLTGTSGDAFQRRKVVTSLLTGALALTVGAIVMAGWHYDNAGWKSLLAGHSPMKPNTALCFILSGLALMLGSRSSSPALIRIARLCNLLAGLVGLLTLGEYSFARDFGIDQLLFSDSSTTPTTLHPGRMAPDAALCFVLLAAGLELAFRAQKTMGIFFSSTILASLVTTLALVAAASHFMKLIGVFPFGGTALMALPSALLFVALGLAYVLISWPPEISIWSFHGRTAAAGAIWTFLLVASLAWGLHREERYALRTAAAFARANISKDISFRQWATSHGGVYVHSSADTPPNPYLQHPAKEVTTTTGLKLTLMNPAYMMRELQHNFSDEYGTRSHITSLKPLNPVNAADTWQSKALKSFANGAKELQEVQNIDGQLYLRIMQPFIVETGCLKCHAGQGYQLGDVRGGIDSSVALETYLTSGRERGRLLALSHGGIWVIGLLGLGFSYRRESLLNAETEQATKALQDYNAELERFNYTLSHELRSPLVTVKSFLEFLIQDLAAADTDRIAKDISYMHTATDKMTQLIDQLVMISRIGRVVNPPVTVTFGELVGDVLQRLAARIEEQGALVEVDQCAIEFFGDRPRLTEIWLHLVENALTFRGENPPRIRIGFVLENNLPVFYVRDNGCGVEPRYHEKIFGLFDKLDAKSKGTGLGLALVKRIVEMYNGSVSIESEGLGHGSCFKFTLPGALSCNETRADKEKR